MADYKQSDVVGTQWNRAYRVLIQNPLGGIPSVAFSEELAINLGSNTITQPSRTLVAGFSPTGEIQLINPETGDLLNSTMSHSELYVALHSLYIQLAKERDDANTST